MESPVAVARAAGLPYDPERLDLLQRLHAELAGAAPVTRLARPTDGPALPFFEAYFSNFIEGTEFAVEEAADIVFKGHIPRARPEDAHDVLGTWKVVSDQIEMSRIPRSVEELTTLLKNRHARIMEGRLDKAPGRFKTDANRAGSTVFVAPELVEGTLSKGFEIYRSLATPLHRAIFMMFLISEVHPFADPASPGTVTSGWCPPKSISPNAKSWRVCSPKTRERTPVAFVSKKIECGLSWRQEDFVRFFPLTASLHPKLWSFTLEVMGSPRSLNLLRHWNSTFRIRATAC